MIAEALAYYPQMQRAVEYYTSSPHYRRETLVPIDELERGDGVSGATVILGRNAHYHHYDLHHIELLRKQGRLPDGQHTTLALYDWHEDLDHDPRGTPVGNGTWAYIGLQQGLYANVYVTGVNPRGWSELNAPVWEDDQIRWPTEETLRLLDRVYLFPFVPAQYTLRLIAGCEPYLAANHSVDRYFVVRDGGFVAVRFKGAGEAVYLARREAVVVSIDLDVLRAAELKADTPQGVMTTEALLNHLDRLGETGRVNAVLVCGLTESQDAQDEASLESVARILAKARELVSS